MCGITGYISYYSKVNVKSFYNAHLKIAHRGPDDEGFMAKVGHEFKSFIGNDSNKNLSGDHIESIDETSVILGHRRLSILDLSTKGHQPYKFEQYWLTYNGEIYNYIELRDELIKHGYSFESNSDTEVFIKGYHYWGNDLFEKLNGMWAAAIFNENDESVTLTRDRFGIKPLYFAGIEGQLVFGSEIKFVASFFNELNVNEQAVIDYISSCYIDHSNETFFKGIFQLLPGCFGTYGKGTSLKVTKYWNIKENNVDINQVDSVLTNAIKLRLISDVEVGALLSGGVDSNLIVNKIFDEEMKRDMQTFSAVFDEEAFSEKKFIEKTIEKTKFKSSLIYTNAKNIEQSIQDLIYTIEEPFRSSAIACQNRLYQDIASSSSIKVVLNGQGADEVFTGYTEHFYLNLQDLLIRLKLIPFLKEAYYLSQNTNISMVKIIANTFKVTIRRLIAEALNINRISGNLAMVYSGTKTPKRFKLGINALKNRQQIMVAHTALREYLKYDDRNSMAFSIESRVPFLDYRMVNIGFGLNRSKKIINGESKKVLREIGRHCIPEEILQCKKKMGFITPQQKWQKEELKHWFDTGFDSIKTNGLFNFLDKDKIAQIYSEYQKGTFKDYSFIWRLRCLIEWKKVWGVNG